MDYPQYLIDARKAYEAARNRKDAAVKVIASATNADESARAGIDWDIADDESKAAYIAYLDAKKRFLAEKADE